MGLDVRESHSQRTLLAAGWRHGLEKEEDRHWIDLKVGAYWLIGALKT